MTPKEKDREYLRQWKLNNPEKMAAMHERRRIRRVQIRRESIEEHRKKDREKARRLRLKHTPEQREKRRLALRKWYENNRERSVELAKIWSKNHPEKRRISQKAAFAALKADQPRYKAMNAINDHKRRVALMGAPSDQEGIDFIRWAKTLGQYRCTYCERDFVGTPHVDHRHPVKRGGGNTRANLCLSCPTCNKSKGAFTVEEFKARRLSAA